ncbi:diguanylate cyclase [Vibrio sp. TH_r3]|uniref:diguanylate cyclase n=1 Tax=Vibrio sp. TH_r3 TaxID=3082084 RepID=UPI0029557FBD|nr:diguanylate cyclase [Vibrio sp. TH_r3]MDV7104621.1 diguanylate cyclase [Vibrio sp. TH_r3]
MNNPLRIRTLMAFIFVTLALGSVFVIEYQHSQHQVNSQNIIKSSAQRELLIIRSKLEADIYLDIFYANSLATIINVSPEMPKDHWQNIAEALYKKTKHLKNLAIAPNDVIEFIYPLEGNKAALGLDYTTLPDQFKTVQKARDQQSIFMAGPLNLVQGGIGLIARTPIFTDPPHNQEYWGVCSAVLDIESLFKSVGIDEISNTYNFAIRGTDGKGALGEVFWGKSSVFDSKYIQETVVLPSGTWQIAITLPSINEAFSFSQNNISRLIGYPMMLLLLVIFMGVYYLYHRAYVHSMRDELTLLPNRRYFMYALEQMITTCQKKGSRFVLLNIDIDKFKAVNDTYGHAIGDKLLTEIALRIKSVLRSSDIVARTGGDEFLIILPRLANEADLQRVLTTIKEAFNAKPAQFGHVEIHVNVSIGYAIYTNEQITASELMKIADLSMYEDKKSKSI